MIYKIGPSKGYCVGKRGHWDEKYKDWDQKGRKEISRIIISHSDRGISYIQFGYVTEGARVELSELYGSKVKGDDEDDYVNDFAMVKLNYPSQFVTSIEGYSNWECIKSLTIGTNQGSYGPYGFKREADSRIQLIHFHYEFGDDFYGFHGSSGTSLSRIGVYIKIDEKVDDNTDETVNDTTDEKVNDTTTPIALPVQQSNIVEDWVEETPKVVPLQQPSIVAETPTEVPLQQSSIEEDWVEDII